MVSAASTLRPSSPATLSPALPRCRITSQSQCAAILRATIRSPTQANPAQGTPANGSAILLAGLPIDGQQAQIIGNTIKNNSSYDSPGGIWLADAGGPLIENNIIANNRSHIHGAIDAEGNVAPLIIQNLIYGNVGDSTQIFNPVGVDNSAILMVGYTNAFGGITAAFTENTVVDNQSLYQTYYQEYPSASQVEVGYAPSPIPIVNNIIIGEGTLPAFVCGELVDTPDVPPQLSHNDILVTGGGAAPVAGSCAGQMGSNGNISVDPLFASTNTSAANPFQLQLQSPAVDAGDNDAPDLPSEDILGHPRIQNAKGLPSAIIDMGVYEYPGVPAQLPAPDFTLQVAPSSLNLGSSAQGQVTVTLTPNSAFTGTVALSCGSLPATLSCSFSPQSIYLTDGMPQTAALTITAQCSGEILLARHHLTEFPQSRAAYFSPQFSSFRGAAKNAHAGSSLSALLRCCLYSFLHAVWSTPLISRPATASPSQPLPTRYSQRIARTSL